MTPVRNQVRGAHGDVEALLQGAAVGAFWIGFY